MSGPHDRRGFLRGLTTLPLIGGSVALIGQPTAVAARPSIDQLEAYKTWLHFEQRFLAWEMAGDPMVQQRYCGFYRIDDDTSRMALSKAIRSHIAFVGNSGDFHGAGKPSATSRAALVLSAVGCDWREQE